MNKPLNTATQAKTCAIILEDSVRLRLRSDVPVGLTLSGGLDSTAILEAAMSVRPGSDFLAFTSIYGDGNRVDERAWAELAVRRHPNVVLNQVKAAYSEWIQALNKVVWHMDGPGYSPAVFPLWEIMRLARSSGVPVLLEGQGADELFGGYMRITPSLPPSKQSLPRFATRDEHHSERLGQLYIKPRSPIP